MFAEVKQLIKWQIQNHVPAITPALSRGKCKSTFKLSI